MPIDVKGISEAEAWSEGVMLPTGWHKVQIDSAEESTTSNDNPQIELQFSNPQGSIRDWLVIVPATIGKVAQLLDAVGIDRDGMDKLDASVLEGKKLAIFVGEEPDQRNPGEMRKRVQSYAAKPPEGAEMPADTDGLGGSPKAKDDDVPF